MESVAGATIARTDIGSAGGTNPAAVDFAAGSGIYTTSTPSPLGLDGVFEGSLAADLPLDTLLRVGISLSGSGEERYLESALAGSVAFRPTEGFTAAARLRLHMLGVDGYPLRLGYSADLGVLATIGSRMRIGLTVVNMIRPRLAGRPRAPMLGLGVSGDLDSSTTLSIDLHQELGVEPSIAIGLSYVPLEDWTVRAGMDSAPFALAVGAGIRLEGFTIDVATLFLARTGVRNTVGAGITW